MASVFDIFFITYGLGALSGGVAQLDAYGDLRSLERPYVDRFFAQQEKLINDRLLRLEQDDSFEEHISTSEVRKILEKAGA